jgi:preprotein translocase subunit SecE
MGAIKDSIGKAKGFMGDVSAEMKKTDWPTRQELLESTGVVVASLVMLGAFIFICDTVLTSLVKYIIR